MTILLVDKDNKTIGHMRSIRGVLRYVVPWRIVTLRAHPNTGNVEGFFKITWSNDMRAEGIEPNYEELVKWVAARRSWSDVIWIDPEHHNGKLPIYLVR